MRALSLFLLLATPAQATSGEMFAEIFAPPGLVQRTRARAEYRHYGDDTVKLRQTKTEVSVPVATGERGSWRANASADYDAIETRERFPDGRLMPNRLWDVGAGFSHSRPLDNGQAAGGTFTVSSPSDRPFGRGRDFGFNLNLHYKIPDENENAWILFLSVSNTRGFLSYLPMPGFAYALKASERVRLVLGVPFALVYWTPADLITISAFYFPLRNAEVRVAYGSRRGLSTYVLANFRARNFRLHDRTNARERLYNEEGLLQAGVNIPLLGPALMVEVGGGYSFARRYYLAEKWNERGSAPTVKPGNVPFGFAKLQMAL